MKILSINAVPYGSPARIVLEIADLCKQRGWENRVAFGFSTHPLPLPDESYHIGNKYSKLLNIALSRITGIEGIFSWLATKLFLKKIIKYKPDIIHLHNLHGWYLNLPMLFRYINAEKIPVVMTLHDCWTFTGHCPHYMSIGCEKWKTRCFDCSLYEKYPEAYIDKSSKMFDKKLEWFSSIKNLTIVTPSHWLESQVKQSVILKDNPVITINNGIDLSIFRYIKSSFKEKFSLIDKKIILGVALDWGYRKGLDVFIKLAETLKEGYVVVLVGIDKNKIEHCPENLVCISRTQSQGELAEIYSAADVFVNATREDNFPTVNIEALACGTPVITFNTGGSPEIIDNSCGSVVEKDDLESLRKEIKRITEDALYKRTACRKRSEQFDKNEKFKEYIKLYQEIYDKNK